ncbi:MAG: hypothetical protein V4603_04025 [Pseudomonadota bacterium]
MTQALKTIGHPSKRSIFRNCALILTMACFAGLAQAQTPGSVDPLWEAPYQEPELASAIAWTDIAAQPNGRMLVLGKTLDGYYVRRHVENGWFDYNFGTEAYFRIPAGMPSAPSLTVDGAGRIYLNSMTPGSANGESASTIMRLHPNGTLDASFGTGGTARPLAGGLLAVQPDSKILLLAQIPDPSRPSPASMAVAYRLLENGQVDTGFGTNGRLTLAQMAGAISDLRAQVMRDGSFVVSLVERVDTRTVAHILKRTANGAADASFGGNGSMSAQSVTISDLAAQLDGKLLVSGTRGGQTLLVRLNANGSLDAGFGNSGFAAAGAGTINDMELAADGRIIAAMSPPALVRLTASGNVDSTFVRAGIDDTDIMDMALAHGGVLLLTTSPRSGSTTARNLRHYLVEPAPRSGSLRSDGAPGVAGFGIDARNNSGVAVDMASMTHYLGLNGFIYPQTTDLDVNADIFVVIATPTGTFMRDTAGNLLPWNGQVSSLLPAYENRLLLKKVPVSLYAGTLAVAGAYKLYLGYKRSNGGPLVYIDVPVPLTITP